MSDQTPEPPDNRLRDALRAEADGVNADADLLARIQAAAGPRPRRHVLPWVLVAASCVVVAGLGAILVSRDGPQVVDSINDPSSTTTSTSQGLPSGIYDALGRAIRCEADGVQTVVVMVPTATAAQIEAVGAALAADPQVQTVRSVPSPEVAAALPNISWADSPPSGYLAISRTSEDDLALRGAVADLPGVGGTSTTDCTEAPNIERPTLVALVRADGMLVTIDLITGEERELYTAGDPREEVEGGAYSIDSVDLSPDGQWIYFSTCCEPAVGMSFRIPTQGGEVEEVGFGAYPRVSPDGRFVATAGSESVYVFATDAIGTGTEVFTLPVACCSSRLAWSPDGTRLALVHGTGAEGDVPEVQILTWDGTALASDGNEASNPGSFVSWTPDNGLEIISGDATADDRSLSQDRSYTWQLWVNAEGVVGGLVPGGLADAAAPIPGVPEAVAADW